MQLPLAALARAADQGRRRRNQPNAVCGTGRADAARASALGGRPHGFLSEGQAEQILHIYTIFL